MSISPAMAEAAQAHAAAASADMLPAPLRRVALIAGEASGDQLGASVIEGLRARHPNLEFVGMCGPRMVAAGCRALADIEELNVMGIVEILRHYPRLRRLRARLTADILALQPDVVIGIDVPDFTFWMEARFKQAGIFAVHLVCPQVWAWRASRIPSLAKAVDLMLTLFPFEAPFLAGHGIKASFIGHPLADRIPAAPDRIATRQKLGLVESGPLVALMPGSRRQELSRHVDLFLLAAQRLQAAMPDARFVAGAVHAAAARQILERHAALAPTLPLTVVERQASEVLIAADTALVVSGTVSLESALCGTPAVVAYRMAALSHWWLRRLVTVAHIALPNLLLEKRLFPEFVQNEATPEALAGALERWLRDGPAREAARASCGQLHQQLAQQAGRSAALAIEQGLRKRYEAGA